MQLWGRTTTNWIDKYSDFIQAWNNQSQAIVNAPVAVDEFDRTSQYMQWYWRHTRRLIQRITADSDHVVRVALQMSYID